MSKPRFLKWNRRKVAGSPKGKQKEDPGHVHLSAKTSKGNKGASQPVAVNVTAHVSGASAAELARQLAFTQRPGSAGTTVPVTLSPASTNTSMITFNSAWLSEVEKECSWAPPAPATSTAVPEFSSSASGAACTAEATAALAVLTCGRQGSNTSTCSAHSAKARTARSTCPGPDPGSGVAVRSAEAPAVKLGGSRAIFNAFNPEAASKQLNTTHASAGNATTMAKVQPDMPKGNKKDSEAVAAVGEGSQDITGVVVNTAAEQQQEGLRAGVCKQAPGYDETDRLSAKDGRKDGMDGQKDGTNGQEGGKDRSLGGNDGQKDGKDGSLSALNPSMAGAGSSGMTRVPTGYPDAAKENAQLLTLQAVEAGASVTVPVPSRSLNTVDALPRNPSDAGMSQDRMCVPVGDYGDGASQEAQVLVGTHGSPGTPRAIKRAASGRTAARKSTLQSVDEDGNAPNTAAGAGVGANDMPATWQGKDTASQLGCSFGENGNMVMVATVQAAAVAHTGVQTGPSGSEDMAAQMVMVRQQVQELRRELLQYSEAAQGSFGCLVQLLQDMLQVQQQMLSR